MISSLELPNESSNLFSEDNAQLFKLEQHKFMSNTSKFWNQKLWNKQ